MEARAILEGLKFALNHGLEMVVVESDCKGVVEDISKQVLDLSNVGAIYDENRELM